MATLSQPPAADEAITFYTGNLTFDLVVNILCRLPVKVLMKLRCVCKSWNSLISDPNFAKEHLRFSQMLLNRRHLLSCHWDVDPDPDPDAEDEFHVCDYRLPSVFNSASTTFSVETQLIHPLCDDFGYIIDSCNGIICLCYSMKGEEEEDHDSILVWNPSIRKFKIFPPWRKELQLNVAFTTFGFGYDRLTDTYKVVAVCCYEYDRSNFVCKTQVMVHTLGTDTWRSIQSFPSPLPGLHISYSGKFVSGAINWLLHTAAWWVIVALDLGNETYQELLLPNCGGADVCTITMGVLRDCLCILAHTNAFVIHVWLMKDYGNKQSWTQLFAIPYNGLVCSPNVHAHGFAHYILEDDRLLMAFMDEAVFVYNPRNGTVKILEIPCIYSHQYYKHVYIESLISPRP